LSDLAWRGKHFGRTTPEQKDDMVMVQPPDFGTLLRRWRKAAGLTQEEKVLDVKEVGGKALSETLVEHLQKKHLLLVLDNFEHLLGASQVVSRLLDTCRELHVLVTSRIPLHLTREHEYAVAPFPVPDPNHLPSLETLLQYESVALFVDRARAVKADFQVTNHSAPAVAETCYRLDGLPLAIVLAAARSKLFPPQALLQRLSSRLTLLTGGARDLPARHQTLRAAIDWSYSLLSEQEQRLFARLSVFAGGCTFEAVKAVCDPEDDVAILEGMARLVDNSLLQQEGERELRFRILETIREYAAEQLEASGEADEVRRHHGLYFLNFAETAAADALELGRDVSLDRLERERDNLRAALSWACECQEVEMGLRLTVALSALYHARGHLMDGRAWLEKLLALERRDGGLVAPSLRARALRAASVEASTLGDVGRARALCEESLRLLRDMGDKREIVSGLSALGFLLRERGEYASAKAVLQEGLDLAQEVEDNFSLALILLGLGDVARELGDADRVVELCEESLRLFRALDLRPEIGYSLHNLGWAARMVGDPERARTLFEESLMQFHHESSSAIPEILNSLALAARDQGNLQQAKMLLLESLSLCHTGRFEVAMAAVSLEEMAGLSAVEGQAERAAQLLGAAKSLRTRIDSPIWPVNRPLYERDLAVAKDALGQERFTKAWETGQAMSLEEAVASALGENVKE
jgi:predicted ATPase